jgi:hypothetical protein
MFVCVCFFVASAVSPKNVEAGFFDMFVSDYAKRAALMIMAPGLYFPTDLDASWVIPFGENFNLGTLFRLCARQLEFPKDVVGECETLYQIELLAERCTDDVPREYREMLLGDAGECIDRVLGYFCTIIKPKMSVNKEGYQAYLDNIHGKRCLLASILKSRLGLSNTADPDGI